MLNKQITRKCDPEMTNGGSKCSHGSKPVELRSNFSKQNFV